MTITTNPESSQSLSQVPMSEKRVYFSVNLANMKEGEYTGFCQLFDGVGALVAMGEAPVKAANDRLQAWCWYDFNNPTEVQPGIWKFKFYLQGKSVAETSLNVTQ